MSEQRRRRKEGHGSEESDLSETEAPVAKPKKKPVGVADSVFEDFNLFVVCSYVRRVGGSNPCDTKREISVLQ